MGCNSSKIVELSSSNDIKEPDDIGSTIGNVSIIECDQSIIKKSDVSIKSIGSICIITENIVCTTQLMSSDERIKMTYPNSMPQNGKVYEKFVEFQRKKYAAKLKINKIDENDDNPEDLTKEGEMQMRKLHNAYMFKIDDLKYICLICGNSEIGKIQYIPGRLNGCYNIKIVNYSTNELLLLWWHSGDFIHTQFIDFINKILTPSLKNKFNLHKITNGIYAIEFGKMSPLISSIWKFDYVEYSL